MKIAIVDLFSASLSLDLKLSAQIQDNNICEVIVCRPGDAVQESRVLDNGGRFFGEFKSSKACRFFYAIKAIFYLRRRACEYDKIFLMWRTLLLLDLFIYLIAGEKLYFFEHNVFRHGRKKVSLTDRLRWVIFPNIVFLSEYSLNRFLDTCKNLVSKKNLFVYQHPPIDESENLEERSSFEAISDARDAERCIVTFLGSARNNRGLNEIISIIGESQKIELEIMSELSSEQKNSIENYQNIRIVSGRMDQAELERVLSSGKIFILPYITSSQSGVFYSIIGNEGLFISSGTGDTGETIEKYGLQDLQYSFNLESLEKSFFYALENRQHLINTIQRIRKDKERTSRQNLKWLLDG